MKRTISFIIALVAIITGANAQNNSFAWYGADDIAKVKTGLGNDSNTEGIWKVFDDSADGGESKVVWDVETADGNPDNNLVQQYGGISGTAVLGKGSLTYNPFAGVGFDVVGDYLGSPAAANASAWEGIAIAYQSDVAPILELSLGEVVDQSIGYAYPRVQLQASPNGTTFVRIPWSDFKQRDTYQGPKISGPDAAKQLVSIRFKIQAPSGSYHFNIIEIGEYNMAEDVEHDSRTLISSVNGTAMDLANILAIGSSVTMKPTVTVTTGKPAYFDTSNGWWQKKVGDNWHDVKSGEFSAGTWRFTCQLKTDSSTDPNNQYKLAYGVTVKVNDTAWSKEEVTVGNNYSNVVVYSPEFQVVPDTPIEGTFAWYSSYGIAKVETGFGDDSYTEGIWKVFDDSGDGGESKVVWDVETADGNPDDNLVQQYGGISGKAVLGKGSLTYNPFAGVGFDVAGEHQGAPAAANASAWEGIAIAYQSDVAPILELSLGDAVDQTIGYAYPRVQLQASPNGTIFVRIPWSDFKQPDTYTGDTKISGPDAAKQLVSIRFKIQAASGSYHFNIAAIGEYYMAEDTWVDNRTKISSVQATTTDIWFIPKFDEELTKPTINVTKGKPAYFDTSNGCWQKKGGKWEDVEDGTFSAGVWRFKCQLRIDKTTDKNNWFVLDKNVDVTINSSKWKKGDCHITKDYSYIEVYSPEFEVEDPDNPIEERTEIALVEGTSDLSTVLPEVGAAVEPPVFSTTSEEPVTFCFDTDGCWQKKVNGKWEDVESGEFSAGIWRFKCQVWVDDEAYVLAENVTVNIDGTDWDCDAVTIGDSYSYTYVYSPEIELEEGEEPIPNEKCDTPTIAFENGKLKFECTTTDVEFVSEITAVDAKKYNSSEVSLTGIYRVSVYAKKEGWQDSDTVTEDIQIGAQMGDMNRDGILSVTDVGILITKILSGK